MFLSFSNAARKNSFLRLSIFVLTSFLPVLDSLLTLELVMQMLQRMDKKLDAFANVCQPMSEATHNFTRLLLQDLGVKHIVRPVIADTGVGEVNKYPWGDKEHEEDGLPGCKLILEAELLPLALDGSPLGLFDVRSLPLPELEAGKRKSHGFSDLALGLQPSMAYASVCCEDLMLSYTAALVELKTQKMELNQRQLLLQLISLSQIAGNGQGVVVLGTDCVDKWLLLHFSSYNTIVVQPYVHGKKCLADFKTLVAGSLERMEKNIAPARSPSIGEDNDMDLGGFQLEKTDKDKAIARESKLRKLADVLGRLYGETPEIPPWALASACPSYYE
jgi:hypothetical protein